MELFNTIVGIVSGTMIIFGFLAAVCRPVRDWLKRKISEPDETQNKRIKALETRIEALENQMCVAAISNKGLLHDKLFYLCKKHLEDGEIGVDELDNLKYIYDAYKANDMNGTGEELYLRCKKLPLKKEEK